jgi:hypothetical protein
MTRRIITALFIAAFGASAHAGPCTDKIAQFELAVRQSVGRAGRCTNGSPLDRRTDQSPTNAKFDQTSPRTGAGEVCGDLGARQTARCTRQSYRVHKVARCCRGNVRSAMSDECMVVEAVRMFCSVCRSKIHVMPLLKGAKPDDLPAKCELSIDPPGRSSSEFR